MINYSDTSRLIFDKKTRKEWLDNLSESNSLRSRNTNIIKDNTGTLRFASQDVENAFEDDMFIQAFGRTRDFDKLALLSREERRSLYNKYNGDGGLYELDQERNQYLQTPEGQSGQWDQSYFNPNYNRPFYEENPIPSSARIMPTQQDLYEGYSNRRYVANLDSEDDLTPVENQEQANLLFQRLKKEAEELYPAPEDDVYTKDMSPFAKGSYLSSVYQQRLYEKVDPLVKSANVLGEVLTGDENKDYKYLRRKYIEDHYKIPLNENPYQNLTFSGFSKYLIDNNAIYKQFHGTERLPENEIGMEELYKEVQPLLAAGLKGKADNIIQQRMNKVAGEHQSGLEKTGIFARQAAGGFTEEMLNTVAIPVGFVEAGLSYVADPLLGTWYDDNRNFWERQDDLPGLVNRLAEGIQGDKQVYGTGAADRFLQGGYSIGAMVGTLAKEAIAVGGYSKLTAPLRADLAVATKSGDAAKIAELTSKIAKYDNALKYTSVGVTTTSALNEGWVDGRQVFKETIEAGESYKDRIKSDLYQQISANPDAYSFDEKEALAIYNELVNQGLKDQYVKDAVKQINEKGGIEMPDGSLLRLSISQVDDYVNQLISEQAVRIAQTNREFSKHEAEYDAKVRHEANVARARTQIQEAAIVALPTMLGVGKLAQLVPQSVLTSGANKLVSFIPNKYGRFAADVTLKSGLMVGGEVAEEIAQGMSSGINKSRADYNIRNYAAGLYYGAGSEITKYLHLGALEGINGFAANAWYDMDPQSIIGQTVATTLLFGGAHIPGGKNVKKLSQIKEDNHTLIGKAFDLIHEYTPIDTGIGNIIGESKAEHIDANNNLTDGFKYLFQNPDDVTVLQSEAALYDIRSNMEAALANGDTDTYSILAANYKAAQASFLAHLTTASNGVNAKFAKQFIDRFQTRANVLNEDEEVKQEVYDDFMKDNSISEYNDMSRDEVLEIIAKDAQEQLDLYQKATEIAKKYNNDYRFSAQDTRPLIFGELLKDLSNGVAKEFWSKSFEKLNDNNLKPVIDKLQKKGDKLSEEDQKYNSILDFLTKVYFNPNSTTEQRHEFPVSDGKLLDQVMTDVIKEINPLIDIDARDAVNRDIRLYNWETDVYGQFAEMYERLLAKQGVLSDAQYKEANAYLDSVKNVSTNQYQKKLTKDLYNRKDNVHDLVRYLSDMEHSEKEVKNSDLRRKLYESLENIEEFANVSKALDIIKASDDIKDFIVEDAQNNQLTRQYYNLISQIIDLASERVDSASQMYEIGTYASLINDKDGIIQGTLTDIFERMKQASEVPVIEDEVKTEEEEPQSDPNLHNPKKDSVKRNITKSRIKENRRARLDNKKKEEAIAKEKSEATEKYNSWNTEYQKLVDEYNNLPEGSIEKYNEILKKLTSILPVNMSKDMDALVGGKKVTLLKQNIKKFNEELKAKISESQKESNKPQDEILDEIKRAVQSLERSKKEKGNLRKASLNTVKRIYDKYHGKDLTDEQKKEFDAIEEYYKELDRLKQEAKKVQKQNKVKKENLNKFIDFNNKLASHLSRFPKGTTWEEKFGYIWNEIMSNKDSNLYQYKDIVSSMFKNKEEFVEFYSTAQEFPFINLIRDEDEIRDIINQVIVSRFLGIPVYSITIDDLKQRIIEREIYNKRTDKRKKSYIPLVSDASTDFASLNEMVGKIISAYNEGKQILIEGQPIDGFIEPAKTADRKENPVPLFITDKNDAVGEYVPITFTEQGRQYRDEQADFETNKDKDLESYLLEFLQSNHTIKEIEQGLEDEAKRIVEQETEAELSELLRDDYEKYTDHLINLGFTTDEVLSIIAYNDQRKEEPEQSPVVLQIGNRTVTFFTANKDYKTGDIIYISDGQGGAIETTFAYYGLSEEDSHQISSLDDIIVDTPVTQTEKQTEQASSRKSINQQVIVNAVTEDVDSKEYEEVKNRIDYEWANRGNVNIGDNIGFVVYTWNSPEGPRRVIYYTTERQEDGSYHILGILDQGSYKKKIAYNSPVGQLISRIKEADDETEGFYYQENGWQVSKVTQNSANAINSRPNDINSGNLNRILDEDNGVYGIQFNGKTQQIIFVKQDKTGFQSTDKEFTVDTLLNTTTGNRDKSTRVAGTTETGANMRENTILMVVPTTDGFEALNPVIAIDNTSEGFYDKIKYSLNSGEIGKILKNDILQRITDLFRNSKTRNTVQRPHSVSLNKFFKTGNKGLVISHDNPRTFSIYIASTEQGNRDNTLIASVVYPADIDIASNSDEKSKSLIKNSILNVFVNGEMKEMSFDDLYSFIVDTLIDNRAINSINVNFEDIRENQEVLNAIIKDGMLYSQTAPLSKTGKLKLSGAQVQASIPDSQKRIALVKFEDQEELYSYNISNEDVQIGDTIESKYRSVKGKVVDTMTQSEYDAWRKDNNKTDKWTSEEVLKQPTGKFIDRHSGSTNTSPIFTAQSNEYKNPADNNSDKVDGNIPAPISVKRKKAAPKAVRQQEAKKKIESQSDIFSNENLMDYINTDYDNIGNEAIYERLDELNVDKDLWNSLNIFEREQLIRCGKF